MPIDYRNYPPDWKQRRARILERAGHRCEHCRVKNYSLVDPDTRRVEVETSSYQAAKELKADYNWCIIIILAVAHLDQDEWNHNVTDDRLAALCQKCHFAHDRIDNQKRKDYGKQWKRHQLRLPIDRTPQTDQP